MSGRWCLSCSLMLCLLKYLHAVQVCPGEFDFYFVIDSSGSVQRAFQDDVVPFVMNVANSFVNPKFRLSIMTFSTDPKVYLPLTPASNRTAIDDAFSVLTTIEPEGQTYLGLGLREVNIEMVANGGDRASVIFVMTDGALDDSVDALNEANLAIARGSHFIVVGVGFIDENQLGQFVSSDEDLFIGVQFSAYLPTILDAIVNRSCVAITAMDPDSYCVQSSGQDMLLTGIGLTNQLETSKAGCRFQLVGSDHQVNASSHDVQYNTAICSAPDFGMEGMYSVEFTPNGISYIKSDVLVNVTRCKEPPTEVILPEVTGFEPNLLCLSSVDKLTVFGTGFSTVLGEATAVLCQFMEKGDDFAATQPIIVSDVEMLCPLPKLLYPTELQLEVSVDGDTRVPVSSGSTLEVVDCKIDPEVIVTEPSVVCIGVTEEVALIGKGFSMGRDGAECMYEFSENISISLPAREVVYDRILCPFPEERLNDTGPEVVLTVLLNATSNSSVTVSLAISDCTSGSNSGGGGSKDLSFVAGIILGLFALILLIATCLMWFMFPVITGRIKGGLPPEPKEPEPQPKAPRKWEVVDASYYGGRGAGGIRPVKVEWGQKGATEEGSKLTKAKDATVLKVNVEAGIAVPPKQKIGCWDLFKQKMRRLYAVIASYRPVRGETKWIVCCPGPHHISRHGQYQ